MTYQRQKFPFLFILLLIFFFQATGIISVSGESWKEQGFIRISTKLPVELLEPGTYFIQQDLNTAPDFRKFISFNNNNDKSKIRTAIAENAVWMRVILSNTSQDTLEVALRLYTQCKGFSVYYLENKEWQIEHAGHYYKEKSFPGSFYESAKLVLLPGENIFYLHHDTPMGKWTLYNYDLVHPSELDDDKFSLIDSASNVIFILIAFLFIIIFQLGYVAVQWFYYRKPEYIDYLVYLFLIGIYFFFRYVLIFRIDFFLYHFSDIMPALNDVLLILPYLYYLRFSRHFINMQEKFPEKNRQIKLVEKWIAVVVVLMVISYSLVKINFSWLIITALMIPLFIYSIWLIIFFYKRRDIVVRFFLIGSICAATGHFLAMVLSGMQGVAWLSVIPPLNITIIGLVLEMFFFNTGLGFKAKVAQDERLKLQLDYYKQIEETRKVEDKLQQMRNNIASDLHDDVGSTLSSIGIYSQLASKEMASNPAASKEILEKISKATQRMMEAMSDIVWAIHSRNDEGVGLFVRMKLFATERLSLSGINYEMDVDEAAEKLSYSMEARRNLMLLFKEIINNAAKHSNAKTVTCRVRLEESKMVFIISDDGVGFDTSNVRKGQGLPGYEARSHAMGGNYNIDSSNPGTVVTIRIPVSQIVAHESL